MNKNIDLKGEYQGWTITYNADYKNYTASKDNTTIRKNDIDKLKRTIDKAERMSKLKPFERTPAFTGRFQEGAITSIAHIGDRHGGGHYVEVWFSYAGGDEYSRSRGRLDLNDLIKDTPENRSKIHDIKVLQEGIDKFETELERFKPSDFLKDTKESN